MRQAAGYYSLSSDNSTPDFPTCMTSLAAVFQVMTIPAP